MTRSSQLDFYPEIDGIRGVMSVIVVLGHLLDMVSWPTRYAEGQAPLYWYWGCMEVFFCISAFCITRNLFYSISHRKDWVSHYLKKRALRIWPAYYMALAICAAVALWVPIHNAPRSMVWDGSLTYLIKTIFFLQYTEMYFGSASPSAIPTFVHSWSVAIEEQFYLLILLVLFLRNKMDAFRGYWLLLPVLLLLPMSQLTRHQGFEALTLLGRFEAFLFGIALAVGLPVINQWRERCRILAPRLQQLLSTCLLLAALPFLYPYFSEHGAMSEIPRLLRAGPFDPYFAFGLLGATLILSVILVPVTPLHWFLRLRPVRYLGDVSYSTYLFHVPTMLVAREILLREGVESGLTIAICAFLAVFTISSLTYHLIEAPFLNRKRRLSGVQTSEGAERAVAGASPK